MPEFLENLILKYLSKDYFRYSFLVHNVWDIKKEDFLTYFIKEKLRIEESLTFYSEEFSRESVTTISEFLNKSSIFYPDVYKVVTIHNVDKLDKVYVNALLKIIEEPNSPTIFFLTAENIQRVLKTMRSRCFEIDVIRNLLDKRFLSKREEIDVSLTRIYEMFFERNSVIKEIHSFYIHQLYSTNILKKEHILKAFESLEEISELEEFNCNEKFLLLDMIFVT